MQKKYVRVAGALLDLDLFERINENHANSDAMTSDLRLDNNETTIPPAPEVLDAIKRYLETQPLNWYPEPEALELKERISAYCGFPSGNIACFPGKDSALENISHTFLEPGMEMLASGPVFSNEILPAKSVGARVVEVEHQNPFSPGIEPIVDNITRRTRLIYLGNPSGVAGSYFTAAELVFLLAYAEQTMIVVDESYFEFSGFTAAELIEKFPNLMILRTFSRAFGLGALKASYVISDAENIGFLNRIRSGDDLDAISQIAASAALENKRYIRDYVEKIDISKKIISSNLYEIGYDFYISPANFILLRVTDSHKAAAYLASEGIYVRDLSGFNQMENFLRITIGTPNQTDMILLVLSRMAERFATGLNRNRIAREISGKKEPAAEPVIQK